MCSDPEHLGIHSGCITLHFTGKSVTSPAWCGLPSERRSSRYGQAHYCTDFPHGIERYSIGHDHLGYSLRSTLYFLRMFHGYFMALRQWLGGTLRHSLGWSFDNSQPTFTYLAVIHQNGYWVFLLSIIELELLEATFHPVVLSTSVS